MEVERRRWSVRALLWGALAGAVTLCAVLASSATAAVSPLEVHEYVADYGVSLQRAEQVLNDQHRGAEENIVGQLEHRLGTRFAGVWFDNEHDEFVVPKLDSVNQ